MRRISDLADHSGHCGFDREDVNHVLGHLQWWLYRAAFIDDDDQAQAHDKWVCDRFTAHAGLSPELEKMWAGEGTYSDGRPISTRFAFSDDPRDWVIHVWHPDPLHPDNRPGTVLECPEEPYRFGKRYLLVMAPGTYRLDRRSGRLTTARHRRGPVMTTNDLAGLPVYEKD